MVYTFYAPRANSPQTALSAGINSTITTVNVIDGSLLPAGPNVCTIGHAVDAETIQYSTRSGNVLSGVVRGFDGTTAKTWNAGTIVSRVLTANDISSLQVAINDHVRQTNNPHLVSGSQIGAVVGATPGTAMMRDGSGRSKVAAPAVADDIARLDTVTTLGGGGPTGWIPVSETWTFSSWSAPVGVITVPSNATLRFSVGMKIRISQTTGGVKHAIIVGVTSTTIICNFGSFVLNNEAITAPHFSMLEAPLAFPPPVFTDITQCRRPGLYYNSSLVATDYNAADPVTANRIFAAPFLVTTTQSFDRIAISVGTSATGYARLGVYADNGAVYPGNLIVGSYDVGTGTAGVKEAMVLFTLIPGIYWLTCLFSATPSTLSTTGTGYPIDIGNAVVTNRAARGYLATFTYAALPAVYPAGAPRLTMGHTVVFVRRV